MQGRTRVQTHGGFENACSRHLIKCTAQKFQPSEIAIVAELQDARRPFSSRGSQCPQPTTFTTLHCVASSLAWRRSRARTKYIHELDEDFVDLPNAVQMCSSRSVQVSMSQFHTKISCGASTFLATPHLGSGVLDPHLLGSLHACCCLFFLRSRYIVKSRPVHGGARHSDLR